MIVDTSVALKWHLKETDSAVAESLLLRTDLSAPATLVIEAGYVLTRLARQRLISADVARGIWADLGASSIDLIDEESLLDDSFELSLRLGAGFYDCIFLALAVATGDILVTADERFAAAVRAHPDLAQRITVLKDLAP